MKTGLMIIGLPFVIVMMISMFLLFMVMWIIGVPIRINYKDGRVEHLKWFKFYKGK